MKHDESYPSYDCNELYESYELINSLVRDILVLEEEMVKWRYALKRHLDPLTARDLQSDIFDLMAERHTYDDAYKAYLNYFGIEDPMESDEHTRKLWRLAHGIDEDSVYL